MVKFVEDVNSLKLDFYHGVVSEILGTLDCGFSMSSMILACCCIDYVSLPLSSTFKNTRTDFKTFIATYLSAANDRYLNATIQDSIYAIRCSLVHTYGDSDAADKLNLKPIFQIESFPNHLETHKDDNGIERFYISVPHFIAEVITGVEKYFRECTDKTKLEEWYKKLIIMNGIQGVFLKLGYLSNGRKIIHSQIHPFIACFDSKITDYKELCNLISKAYLQKHNYWVDL